MTLTKKLWNYEIIVSHLPEILDFFHLHYVKNAKRISLACPIHEGSKRDGVSIYTSGQKFVGNWTCFTSHCEEQAGRTILDFVQVLLDKNGIKEQAGSWLKAFIGGEISEDVGEEYFTKKRTVETANILSKTNIVQPGVSRHYIRSSLIIPAKYYLERGYTRDTLEKFDVGLCITPGKQMTGRIVVPVYDDAGENMIGCVGRTIKPQCLLCKKFHYDHETCPDTSYEQYAASKWVNSKNFKADNYLYNFWHAKENVELWRSVVLTEGQGDVWRLDEAGIPIGLGVFGAKLSDGQVLKLQSLPVTNIIVAMDSDEAGISASDSIVSRLRRFYNVDVLRPSGKDIGDMSTTEVKDLFLPLLSRYKCNPT